MFRPVAPVILLWLIQITRVFSDTGTFQLPPLPYDYNALEPHIGRRTLEIHHDKHHAKYVNTLNSMIEGSSEFSSYQGNTLTDIIKKSYGSDQGVFNNAAQSWNHEFYWKCT
jgi:Fe-Mn family superoxide dismutase